MDIAELQVFLAVATERSFSRAAARLHRTQPAVSQAIKRLEEELDERLFDRSSKGGQLTEAGKILLDYAGRLTRLRDEAEGAVRELQDLRRGRVLIGANEAAVHVLLPVVERFRQAHPQAQVEVSRRPSRQIASEVLSRTLDFGVLTFPPRERGLLSLSLGEDELVMLMNPSHPLTKRRHVTMEELGRQTVIAPQRSVAGTRSGPPSVRAASRTDQYPDRAAQPRWNQTRRRDGPGCGPPASAMCVVRDRERPTGGGEGPTASPASSRPACVSSGR